MAWFFNPSSEQMRSRRLAVLPLRRRPRARLPRHRRLWLPPVVAQRLPRLAILAVLGPGIVSGFADNDAGGITTYSVVGAQFGYALLWVVLASLVALFFTQEVGARLGLATGRGLLDLIRELYGPRWGALAIATMLLANLGDTIAEFAGIGAALGLFGVPLAVADGLAAAVVLLLLSRGSFRRVQFVFLGIGAGVSVAYALSAILAHPDWGRAVTYTFVPHGTLTAAYLLAIVGTVGTTITPWGQAFIQSYTADKRLSPEALRGSRIDVATGAFLTNLVAAFIVIAAASALWQHGHTHIPDAAAAAKALGPLAGHLAETVFALGLLAASFLGLGTVPLTSAYATTEALGLERGLDLRVRQAPAFYGMLAFFVGVAAVFVLIPGLPLIRVMFLSQVFDGLLLPVILVFVMLLARRTDLLGPLRSGRALVAVGWLIATLMSVLSIALVLTLVVP
jgi:NRAMP (natural resistance-associated macrophage protein)-like metal ion transporter